LTVAIKFSSLFLSLLNQILETRVSLLSDYIRLESRINLQLTGKISLKFRLQL